MKEWAIAEPNSLHLLVKVIYRKEVKEMKQLWDASDIKKEFRKYGYKNKNFDARIVQIRSVLNIRPAGVNGNKYLYKEADALKIVNYALEKQGVHGFIGPQKETFIEKEEPKVANCDYEETMKEILKVLNEIKEELKNKKFKIF